MAMKRNTKGFSLVELLIVVMVIGVLMSIAIPGLLASRRSANETAAVGNLRTIDSAETAYLAQTGRAATFANLRTGNFLDVQWTNGVYRTGFIYSEVAISATGGQYHITAIPSSTGNGRKSYSLIEDHVVRYTSGLVSLARGSGTAIGS
jgi:type IV pilus assembly protein PilA